MSLAALATLVALATLAALAALAALVSNVLVFALHNFHPYYCILGFASGGLWRPLEASGALWRVNHIVGHLKARSLAALAALAALVSNVRIFALHNFHPYYCLLGFASGGLLRPNRVTGHLKATSQFEFIAAGRPGETLQTCFNMPYTTFIPIIICLVWPLESSGGLQRPK